MRTSRTSASVLSLKLFPMCLLALTLALSQSALAQTANYDIPRVSAAPTIDGEVNTAEWAQATQVALDIETSPSENIPASVQTTAYMMEDGENLL